MDDEEKKSPSIGIVKLIKRKKKKKNVVKH